MCSHCIIYNKYIGTYIAQIPTYNINVLSGELRYIVKALMHAVSLKMRRRRRRDVSYGYKYVLRGESIYFPCFNM